MYPFNVNFGQNIIVSQAFQFWLRDRKIMNTILSGHCLYGCPTATVYVNVQLTLDSLTNIHCIGCVGYVACVATKCCKCYKMLQNAKKGS